MQRAMRVGARGESGGHSEAPGAIAGPYLDRSGVQCEQEQLVGTRRFGGSQASAARGDGGVEVIPLGQIRVCRETHLSDSVRDERPKVRLIEADVVERAREKRPVSAEPYPAVLTDPHDF